MTPTSNPVIEFTIPYTASAPWFDIAAAKAYWIARLQVVVLNVLKQSNSTTTPSVNCSVQLSFSNPEVAGLTLNNLALKVSNLRMRAQVGKEHAEQKKMSDSRGVVSGPLKSVSKIAATISTVPYIGEVAAVVAPVAGILAGIAEAFGYDKPTDLQNATRVLTDTTEEFQLGMGLDMSRKLALDPKNGVARDYRLFKDDRDFNLFCEYGRLPSIIISSSFDSTLAAEAEVVTFYVHPGQHAAKQADGNIYQNYQNVLCSMFRYWRGSMDFRVHFICSKFVVCRVRITWIPDNTSIATDTSGGGDFVSRIVDISGETITDFKIPYLQNQLWSHCALQYLNPNVPFQNGRIHIHMVHPVTFTDVTADSTVYYNIWQANGEDMRFACPTPMWTAISPAVIVMDRMSGNKAEETRFHAQMGTEYISMREAFKKSFPTILPCTSYIEKGLTMGEEIQDFATYYHRYHFQSLATRAHGATTFEDPYGYALNQLSTQRFMHFNKLFNFRRGSTRWKVMPQTTAGTQSDVTFTLHANQRTFPHDSSTGNLWTDTNGGTLQQQIDMGMVYQINKQRGSIDCEIPYYNTQAFSNQWFQSSTDMILGITNFGNAGTDVQAYVLVAAGDDFSVGCPLPPFPLTPSY